MVETRVEHRDEPNGLFIGTSKILLALMNSAPAELLHPLTYAALQPSWPSPVFRVGCLVLFVLRSHPVFEVAWIAATTGVRNEILRAVLHLRRYASAIAKKNAGDTASAGIPFQKSQYFFQRKRRLT